MNHVLLAILLAPGPGIHIHVDGEGYFRFGKGVEPLYSADALLTTSQGVLATPEGYPLLPKIHVPTDGRGLKIDIDGTVHASGQVAGRIVLAMFASTAFTKSGPFLRTTAHSTIGYPGEATFGVIQTIGGESKAIGKTTRPLTQKQSQDPYIEVALKSEVTGDEILLGDVAKIEAGDETTTISQISLGPSPIISAERGLSRGYLLSKIRGAGINIENLTIDCPTGAKVIRKSQKVDEEAMLQAALGAVKTKLGSNVAMKLDRSISEVWVPAGELLIDARDVIQSGDGAVVSLEIQVAGKVISRRTVNLVPVDPMATVPAGTMVKVKLMKNGAIVEVSAKTKATCKVGGLVTVETEFGSVFSGTLKSPSLVEVQL